MTVDRLDAEPGPHHDRRPWRRTVPGLATGTTPEAWFIVLCLRVPDDVDPAELRRAAAMVGNWEHVVEMATRHRVAAYVQEGVTRAGVQLAPEIERALRHVTLLFLAEVMKIDAELRRVVQGFDRAGIPTIVLKGPVLARTIYPSSAFRPYGDIDLNIQDRDEMHAVALLLDHGYAEKQCPAEDARRAHAGHLHGGAAFHRQFLSADGGVLIETHTDPLQLGLRSTCEAARWQRASRVPGLPGTSMLGPEDQVVQLSAHVHKHGFDRLIWLKDLDVLVRCSRGRLDWVLVERVARDEGVLGSVWYSLYLAATLLATPLAPGVLERLRPSLPVRILYRWIWPMARIAECDGIMRRRAVQFHAAESWRGMLPSLVVMGRRGARLRAALSTFMHV